VDPFSLRLEILVKARCFWLELVLVRRESTETLRLVLFFSAGHILILLIDVFIFFIVLNELVYHSTR